MASNYEEVFSAMQTLTSHHIKRRIEVIDHERQYLVVMLELAEKREQVTKVNLSIIDLRFSVRARKCLIRLGVKTIDDLLKQTEYKIKMAPNVGERTLKEIKEKLSSHGLTLASAGIDEP